MVKGLRNYVVLKVLSNETNLIFIVNFPLSAVVHTMCATFNKFRYSSTFGNHQLRVCLDPAPRSLVSFFPF